MTSQINYISINTTYPVAGQDNDSQGFRNNFTAISAGLGVAKSEITALQTNTLLKADLATGTTPVVNNLLQSSITNGTHNQFYGIFYPGGTVSTTANINLANGSIQQFTLAGNATLTFTGWPAVPAYGIIRVILKGDTIAVRTPVFATANGGVVRFATGFSPFTVGAIGSTKLEVIEAWSVDAGANVYIKLSGEY